MWRVGWLRITRDYAKMKGLRGGKSGSAGGGDYADHGKKLGGADGDWVAGITDSGRGDVAATWTGQ